MATNIYVEDGIYQVRCGACLEGALAEGRILACDLDRVVDFDFNGVKINIAKDSDLTLIHRDFYRAMRGNCICRAMGKTYAIRN